MKTTLKSVVNVVAEPKQKYDTQEITPRSYCWVLYDHPIWEEGGGTKFYYDAATDIIGNTIRTAPSELSRRFALARRDGMDFIEATRKRGYPPYERKFEWPSEFFNLPIKKAIAELRSAIEKMEGHTTLWDANRSHAVQNLTIRGMVLSADVMSKSSGEYYKNVNMRNAFWSESGYPDIRDMFCPCQAHGIPHMKGGIYRNVYECLHIAAMRKEFQSRLKYRASAQLPLRIEDEDFMEKVKDKGVFAPFCFDRNWTYNNGTWQALDKTLAALEIDVIVSRYLKDMNYFEINRRLHSLPVPVVNLPFPNNPAELIRSGKARFEILPEKQVERAIPQSEAAAREYLNKYLRDTLFSRGYKRTGVVIDMGFPAVRYEKNQNIVDVVFSPEYIFCVRRVRNKNMPNLSGEGYDESYGRLNPIQNLGMQRETQDDAMRIMTPSVVDMPSRLYLPEGVVQMSRVPLVLKNKWKNQIRESFGDSPSKLKYAGLYYYDMF